MLDIHARREYNVVNNIKNLGARDIMALIISEDGKNAKRVNQSKFDKEDSLQRYITDNPDCVPIYEIDEDIRLLILAREFSTKSGPIDALGIDQLGNIYVIETKLYKNTDKRTVMAQVLDYGAALWSSSIDFAEFLATLDKHTQKEFAMPARDKIKDFFGLGDDQCSELELAIQLNLGSGVFKFVVLMDELHDRLKDLIRFMNMGSQFDTYAVELDYYRHDKFEILIPRLYGAEVKKEIQNKSIGGRKKWDEASFMDQVGKTAPTIKNSIKKLYKWSEENAEIKWGTGTRNGSFSPLISKLHPGIAPITVYQDGSIMIKYSWFNENISSRLHGSFSRNVDLEQIQSLTPDQLASKVIKINPMQTSTNIDSIMRALSEI